MFDGDATKMDVVMEVEDASKAEEVMSEDEISEPEEGKSPVSIPAST